MQALTLDSFESVTASFVAGLLAIVLRWAARERSRLHLRVPRRRRGVPRRLLQDRVAVLALPLRSLFRAPSRAHMPLMR